MQYCMREIFGGVKYWRIHISITLDDKVLVNSFASCLDSKTKTFGGYKFGELPQICQIPQYFSPPNISCVWL